MWGAALEYLHVAGAVHLDARSMAHGVSSSNLVRKLTRGFGMGPMSYLSRHRVRRVTRPLQPSDELLVEIDSGFSLNVS